MFCFNDFDPKMFRFFRFLICLFLVLCILVNCSPLRARATGIAVGIGIGVTTIAGLIALAYGVQISPDQLPSAASELEAALNNGVSSGALTKDVLDLWLTAASGGKIKLETANRAIADIVVDWVDNFYYDISNAPVVSGSTLAANTPVVTGINGSTSSVSFDSIFIGTYSCKYSDTSILPSIYSFFVCPVPNYCPTGLLLPFITIDDNKYYYWTTNTGSTSYISSSHSWYNDYLSLMSVRVDSSQYGFGELISMALVGDSPVHADTPVAIGGLHGLINDGTGTLANTAIPDINLGSSSYAGGLYGSNDDDGYINDNILSAGSFIWADLIADLGGKSATITIEDEEGKTHVYPITDTGLGEEILTPSETLPGTGTETGVGTAPVSDFLSWLYDLLIRALEWLLEGLQGIAQWIVDVLLGGLSELLSNLGGLILSGIKALFIPKEGFLTAQVEALTARFGFFGPIVDTAKVIAASLKSVGEPPVIYAHFQDAEGSFDWGGTVAVLDMSWYSRYKPAGDAFLSSVIWAFFAWRVFIKLPGIISGTAGAVRSAETVSSDDKIKKK